MTAQEKVQYIDDFFKRRIHDDGYDGLLKVATRIFEPTDNKSFIVITFILERHYYFRHVLSVLTIDNVVNIKEYLNYIYDDAKESLFKKQKEDMLGIYYKEITAYIEDYFKRRIHDDGLDDIMNVDVETSIETFDTVIAFSLYKFYHFKCILLYKQFENDRRDKFLSFIYEGSKEELLQFKKEDLQKA